MNILAIGDVVGAQGCAFLRQHLPAFKRWKGIDLCIANGENSAVGNGITPDSAQDLFDSGVDFITTGNHVYRRREVYAFLDERQDIIRPGNYHAGNPGSGWAIYDMGYVQVGILNVSGNAYMDTTRNLFDAFDVLYPQVKDCPIILVDLHAEATAEKRAFGFYLDGRVSALWGTHTHVQTADEQVLPQGTGYITDLGMTGPKQSVLGIAPDTAIQWLKTGMPTRFQVVDTQACILNGCIFTVDQKTGKCTAAERVVIE